MSTALRQILLFFIVILVVKCSQDIYNPDGVNLPRYSSAEQAFLRIGRSDPQKREGYIRIGRAMEADKRAGYIRMGRPMQTDQESSFLRIGRGQPQFQLSDETGYFAFPRQGRAMSFYFPRMGRSGDDVTSESDCCPEGVRNVFAMSKGAFEICPRSKPCCSGFEEKAKLYSNVVLTECTRDTSLDKIRELMTEN